MLLLWSGRMAQCELQYTAAAMLPYGPRTVRGPRGRRHCTVERDAHCPYTKPAMRPRWVVHSSSHYVHCCARSAVSLSARRWLSAAL